MQLNAKDLFALQLDAKMFCTALLGDSCMSEIYCQALTDSYMSSFAKVDSYMSCFAKTDSYMSFFAKFSHLTFDSVSYPEFLQHLVQSIAICKSQSAFFLKSSQSWAVFFQTHLLNSCSRESFRFLWRCIYCFWKRRTRCNRSQEPNWTPFSK